MKHLILSLLSLLSVLSLPAQTTGQWELRKKTAGGMVPYGITAEDGKAIGFAAGLPAMLPIAAAWTDITGKPSTFPPDAHTQAISTIIGLQTALDGKAATATTLAGYGITDAITAAAAASTYAPLASPTFTGTVTIPSGAAISGYLTTTSAAAAYQPLDSDLTSIAALSTQSFGRALLTYTSALGIRTYLSAASTSSPVITDRITINSAADFPYLAFTRGGASTVLLTPLYVTGTETGTVNLPIIDGANIITNGDTGTVTNAMLTGSIALSKLAQTSATSGQVIAWNGTAWAPATSAAVTDGDKGDVVVSGSGATWTLDTGAVTTAKITDANVTAAKLATGAVDLTGSKITGVLAAANGGTGGAAALDRFRANPSDWNFMWGAVTTTGTSGSGSNSPSNHSINVSSGATANSRGIVTVPTTNSSTFLGPYAGDYRYADFSRRTTIGVALVMIQATTNGTAWIKVGQSASTTGDMAARGFQIKVSNLTLTAACHNGTSLTSSSTLATLTTSAARYLIIQSDGAGAVTVYLDGTLVATLSGGPTSATTGNFEVSVECTNGADSATQRVQVSPVKVVVAP